MTILALIRHGFTEWNERHLLQGQTDVPLSAAGRAQVRSWTLPREIRDYVWLSSPLSRALETATLLRGEAPPTDERLREMSWGRWEGYSVEDLRAELGDEMRENELRALDFQPPDGESPRQVQARVWPLLAELSERGEPVLAVTHKGVIRAIYAEAVGWDMLARPEHKVEDGVAQVYEIGADGHPTALLDVISLERDE